MSLTITTRIAVLIAGLLLISACGLDSAGDGASDVPDAQGTWGEKAKRSPHLELTDEGVTGSDGCNNLRGSYEIEDGTLVFSMQAQTLMACSGVDTWLSRLSTASIDGDTLTAYDNNGDEIGTLERTA